MSMLKYIQVNRLSEAISTHLQSAECGEGTVAEAVILGPHKSVGLARIKGISFDRELLEGVQL